MKGSHWFIIFIVAFLVIMFAVEYHLPKKFVWTPTFGHYDDQPFGCACSIACCLLLCPKDTHCRKRHSISWRRKTRCIAGEYWQLPMTWH